MRTSFVVAMDRNGLIGSPDGLPWRLPADLKRFRKLTIGHPIIMGRKTLESIGGPLKERVNIVLTRRTDSPSDLRGCVVVHSLDEAMQKASEAAQQLGVDEIFVIGGAEIFRQAMPLINRVYLTIVEGQFTGDTWFPFDDSFTGIVIGEESWQADEKNIHPHRLVVLDRADGGKSIRESLHLTV